MSIRDWFADRRELLADLDRQRNLLAEKDEELRECGQAIAAIERRMGRRAQRTAALDMECRSLRRQLADANEQLNVRAGIGTAIFPPFTRAQAEAIDDHARDKRQDDL